MQSYLEVGYERPFYNNTLSKAFKEHSIGSPLCTNIAMLKISFFSFNIYCCNISAFQTEPDRDFIVKIKAIRVFPHLFHPW